MDLFRSVFFLFFVWAKDFVLEKEENTSVRCTFMLKTQFAEYTWDHAIGRRVRSEELSLPGPLATFQTRNLSREERQQRGGGPKAGRRLREALVLENGVRLVLNGSSEVSAERGVNESFV